MIRSSVLPLVMAGVIAITGILDGQPLEVTVTSISGQSIFLDQGRDAGVSVGMRVRLFPAGSEPIEAIVQAVSSHNARAVLPEGVSLPETGTKGQLDILDELATPSEQDTSYADKQPATPQTAPWLTDEYGDYGDSPMLAPAFQRMPKDRPVKIRGRLFSQIVFTKDLGSDRNNEFFLGRVGLRLEATNVFGKGGRLLFDGDVDRRGTDLLAGGDDTDDRLRIDRLSYAIGGEAYSTYRFEIGRFFSVYLPELGLLDGVEGALQFENGLKLGAGFGALARPFPARATGEDMGFHLFADYHNQDLYELSTILAYQKTWHEGAPDRDLLVGRINLRPTDTLWLYGSLKVDLYTSGDELKGSGPKLTELWAQARYTPNATTGGAVTFSHFSWPDLKRREFESLPAELVRDGHVDRLDLSGWYYLFENLRLSSRLNLWIDQDDNGSGGELGADWTRLFQGDTHLHTAVYFTQGSFTEGVGLRARARQQIGALQASIGYDQFHSKTQGLINGEDSSTRQTLQAGLDYGHGKWYHSFNLDYNFGDGEQAYTLALNTQYRF